MSAMFRYILLFSIISLLLFSCGSSEEKETDVVTEPAPHEIGRAPSPRINFLNEQIRENPGDANLYFLRSVEYYDLDRFGEALYDVNQAIKRDSTNQEYFIQQGKIYFNQFDITRSMNSLREAHRLDPKNEEPLYFMGKYMYYYSQYDEAMGFANQALRIDIFNPDVYFLKAMIFKETGDIRGAKSNLQTAVEQDPEFYEAYMQLGLLFSKSGDRLALQYFRNALRVDPESTEAMYGKAMFYQEQEDYEQALEIYAEIIEIDARFARAYYNKGFIYFQKDSIRKADRFFGIAVNVSPTYADAYYMRGLCAEVEGDFETARFYYRQVLGLEEHALATQGITRLQNR